VTAFVAVYFLSVCRALHITFFFLCLSIDIQKLIGQLENSCSVLSRVDMSGLFDSVDKKDDCYCVDCVNSGFRREVDEICALLGNHAVYSGNYLPTFRDNLSAQSSRVDSRPLKTGPGGFAPNSL
jgi:hypothetical protein